MGQVFAGGDLYHVVSDKTIGAVTALPMMSFRLFLLCSFVLLGRPQDLLTFLQPLRLTFVLTVLAVAVMVFGARRHELSAVLLTSESKRYFLFYFIMIVGIPFAYHRGAAFHVVFELYVVNMLYFVLLVFHVTSLQRLKSLVWVICLCVFMYGVLGGLLQSSDSANGRVNLAGSMFDANDTAYVLVSLFPLCLFVARFDKKLLKKLIAVAAIFGAIAIILKTGSRGGILGFGVVMLILLLTKAGQIGNRYKLLTVVMLIATSLLFRDLINVERYLTLTDLSSDYNLSSKGGRVDLWESAIRLSFANPLTGVGARGFGWAHFLAELETEDPDRKPHNVHNSYLQISAETGLVGFGIFMSLIVSSLFLFIRIGKLKVQPKTQVSRELGALGGVMLIGLSGLLVSAFFLSQAYSIFFTLYFALAAAIARIRAGIEATHGTADMSGP